MTEPSKQAKIFTPPFRPTPESARRIMRTMLVVLSVPALVAAWLFGVEAVKLMLVCVVTALAVEIICNRFHSQRTFGSTAHSITMALLLSFTLPITCNRYIAAIGVVVTIAIGKHLFGGLGKYWWHPVLIGRFTLELFFASQLAFTQPLDALRQFDGLAFVDSVPQLSQYLLEHLPALELCMIGQVPGGIGQTSGLILILVGLFFIYRGYLNWQLPLTFIACACIAAAVFPVKIPADNEFVYLPIIAQGLEVGLTYINYHLFTGGLLLTAFVFSSDMTSRPITLRGQIIFAAAAGILTITLRLYSPIPMPCYAALLTVNTLRPIIDRLTR